MRQDYERAVIDLRRALAIDGKHYKALAELGDVLKALGDKKGALESYRKAIEVNPFLDDTRTKVDELSHVDGQDI